MKTYEVISLNESELVGKLKTMSIEELEEHARAIVKDMGSDNYPGLMKQVMQTVKDTQGAERFQALQACIKDFLPNEAVMSDIYERLAAILMMILSRKFRDLMGQA